MTSGIFARRLSHILFCTEARTQFHIADRRQFHTKNEIFPFKHNCPPVKSWSNFFTLVSQAFSYLVVHLFSYVV